MSWAGANVEDCVRMTKFRVLVRKLDNSEIESQPQDFDRSPSTTPNESDYDSDILSDTSSGSSGGVSDFPEEEPGSPNFSNDSSMTIEYTPPHSDIEANSPGSTQDMAIVIDDEEEDSPLCSYGQNMDVIDLTEDTEMDPTPWIIKFGREKKKKSQ